jgi:hypothetical protein
MTKRALCVFAFAALVTFLVVLPRPSQVGATRYGGALGSPPESAADAARSLKETASEAPVRERGGYTFWSTDYHIAPIADIADVFRSLCDTAGLCMKVEEHSFSGACASNFGGRRSTCAKGLRVISKVNGFELCPRPIALRRAFYEAYRGPNSPLQHVDAFVCNHPPALCELYMPFNKSILIVASVNLEFARENPTRWRQWLDSLRRIGARPRVEPRRTEVLRARDPRLRPFCWQLQTRGTSLRRTTCTTPSTSGTTRACGRSTCPRTAATSRSSPRARASLPSLPAPLPPPHGARPRERLLATSLPGTGPISTSRCCSRATTTTRARSMRRPAALSRTNASAAAVRSAARSRRSRACQRFASRGRRTRTRAGSSTRSWRRTRRSWWCRTPRASCPSSSCTGSTYRSLRRRSGCSCAAANPPARHELPAEAPRPPQAKWERESSVLAERIYWQRAPHPVEYADVTDLPPNTRKGGAHRQLNPASRPHARDARRQLSCRSLPARALRHWLGLCDF